MPRDWDSIHNGQNGNYPERSDRRTILKKTFFFQAEDGIRDVERSRGLGDVYKRQGKVSSHDETRRDLLCRLRTTESTGSSHDRTKRETLRGIPPPRYYTGFLCTASKHHGTLQDLSTKSFPGTGNFSILYVYQTRLIWGKVLFCEYL